MGGGILYSCARALASALHGAAGSLDRLSAKLAGQDGAADPAYVALSERFPGAPEHWLAYIAARAPHLAYATDAPPNARVAPAPAPRATERGTMTFRVAASARRPAEVLFEAEDARRDGRQPSAEPAMARTKLAQTPSNHATAGPPLVAQRSSPARQRPRLLFEAASSRPAAPAPITVRDERRPRLQPLDVSSSRPRGGTPGPPPEAFAETLPDRARRAPRQTLAFDAHATRPPPTPASTSSSSSQPARAAPAPATPLRQSPSDRAAWIRAARTDATKPPTAWRDAPASRHDDEPNRWPKLPSPEAETNVTAAPSDLSQLRAQQDDGAWSG
jgi:hypothetical protein